MNELMKRHILNLLFLLLLPVFAGCSSDAFPLSGTFWEYSTIEGEWTRVEALGFGKETVYHIIMYSPNDSSKLVLTEIKPTSMSECAYTYTHPTVTLHSDLFFSATISDNSMEVQKSEEDVCVFKKVK